MQFLASVDGGTWALKYEFTETVFQFALVEEKGAKRSPLIALSLQQKMLNCASEEFWQPVFCERIERQFECWNINEHRPPAEAHIVPRMCHVQYYYLQGSQLLVLGNFQTQDSDYS